MRGISNRRSVLGRNMRSKLASALLSAGALSLCLLAQGVSNRAGAQAAPPPPVPPAGAAAPAAPSTKAGPLITGGIDEKTGSVRLLVNKSVTLTTSRPYKRLSVGQP